MGTHKAEIEQLELEGRLMAQEHSKRTCRVEMLRLKDRIEQLEATLVDLDTAIEETKSKLAGDK